MDFLQNNPVAHMYGPQFLILYGAVSLIVVATVVWYMNSIKRIATFPALTVASDPYEIAYLRGGENEVIRIVIFALLQKEYIQIHVDKNEKLLSASIKPETASGLNDIEMSTLRLLQKPLTAQQIFASDLTGIVKGHLILLHERFTDEGLFYLPSVKTRALCAASASLAVILGLGGYKTYVALDTGHHKLGFLLVMATISTIAVILLTNVPRLTNVGSKYLEQLQLAHANLRNLSLTENVALISPDDYQSYLLAMAIFGTTILNNTPYSDLGEVFVVSTSNDGGCGSSCGGGCSSSCGGGGCGGCGGD